jgi:hypothetical protein
MVSPSPHLIPPLLKPPTYAIRNTVTWSDTYFSNASTSVQIQGTYHDGSGEGFTSPRMLASRGFYTWTIDSALLTGRDTPLPSMNVSLSLAYFQDLYGNDVEQVPGPTVMVTSTPFDDPKDSGGGGGDKPNVVAIAVPIVVIVVFLALAGLCIWSWRRRGTVPVLGALKRRSTGGGGQGYGVRQSRAQRVGGEAGMGAMVGAGADDKKGGVELTDRESWSPGTSPAGNGGQEGRNVFREELRRQEMER